MHLKISTGVSWNRLFLETAPTGIRPRHLPISDESSAFTLGEVGHFAWLCEIRRRREVVERALGLAKRIRIRKRRGGGNKSVTIALFKGQPSPETIDHMSFHLPDMATLRRRSLI